MKDVEVYQFFEKGSIRGEVICIGQKHVKADNKYITLHDKNKPLIYILCIQSKIIDKDDE